MKYNYVNSTSRTCAQNRRDGVKIYKYIYVPAVANGFFSTGDHRELIDKYSAEGWRFVTAIPTDFGGHGQIKEFDLVFEKEETQPL